MSSKNGVRTTLNGDTEAADPSNPEDRRHSFRMTSETRAVLRVRRREYVVELGDQSRGGFSVWLDRSPTFKVDQSSFLRSGRGWSRVRVAYIERVDARCRVGLEFLKDLDDPRHGKVDEGNGSRFQQVYFFGILFFSTVVAGLVITHILFPGLDLWQHLSRFRNDTIQVLRANVPW
jgi:hypothetical protein